MSVFLVALQEATNWPSAAVQIVSLISTIIVAYFTYKTRQTAKATGAIVQENASTIKTAAEDTKVIKEAGDMRDAVIEDIKRVGEKTHKAANSGKAELERQNAALIALAKDNGVAVPLDLYPKDLNVG